MRLFTAEQRQAVAGYLRHYLTIEYLEHPEVDEIEEIERVAGFLRNSLTDAKPEWRRAE